MLHNIKAATLTIGMILYSVLLFAQPKENDPYTILGLGNINDLNFASLSAMPGLSATYHDAFNLNIQNPATSSFLKQTAFEAGGFYQFKKMATPTESDKIHTGNLGYLALGLPLINQINETLAREKKPYGVGMTFSLTPFSRTGYDLERQTEYDNIGRVVSTFLGEGGSYKFMWGNSFRYKNLAVGANIGYLFGKQSSEQWDFFLDFSDEYRNFYRSQISLGGFIWNLGALYEYVLPEVVEYDAKGKKKLKQRTRISVGVYGNSKNKIGTTSEILQQRRQTVGNILVDVDTIAFEEGSDGKMTLPAEFGIGIMASRDANWKVGMDFSLTNWSQFSNNGINNNLANSYKIGFGAEYIPKHNAIGQYRKKILYRIGGFYKTDPRRITAESDQFSHAAVTFGVGLPLQPDPSNKGVTSFVNLSTEIGRYGDENFLKETYFKLNIGFTLNDNRWFFKRKYN